jgi:hypothetical protein
MCTGGGVAGCYAPTTTATADNNASFSSSWSRVVRRKKSMTSLRSKSDSLFDQVDADNDNDDDEDNETETMFSESSATRYYSVPPTAVAPMMGCVLPIVDQLWHRYLEKDMDNYDYDEDDEDEDDDDTLTEMASLTLTSTQSGATVEGEALSRRMHLS